ncbi:MAG: penicillin-binding protein 1A [Burkholderiales bacterium]|nr:penicillin-binding protein 1A [Burkholderiales bacterium]
MTPAAPAPPPSPKPAPRGAASTRSRRSSPLLRALAWLVGLGCAALGSLLLVVGVALAVAYPQLPDIASLTDYRPKLPLRVFSADGVLLGEFGQERRHFTPIGQTPQIMKDAVLAAEDARFYEHGGVDYIGVARAALENLRDPRSQGGSTITMQVARNFYLSSEKTFTRKIYEILLTWKIESALTKDKILELYMNQIYLGQRANGFAAAAETYFGIPLRDVTVAQAAMLAGLPKAPSAYNPIANPKRATERQHYVIQRMLDNGYITPEQRDQALAEVLHYRTQSEVPTHAEYVAEMARQIVYAQYGDDTYTRGLNVYLTINSADQSAAYHALRRSLIDFELRQVYRGPEAYVDLPADPAQLDARVAEALTEHPDDDELRSGVVLEASPKKVVAMLQTGDTVTVTGDGLRPVASGLSAKAAPKVQIRRGAVVRLLQNAKGGWTLTQVPEVQGAFVAQDPRNGEIRALVGGFDFSQNKFNHVTQAWRQPGSSFKPFIYSAALEKGFTPLTIVNDAPMYFDAAQNGGQAWEPKDYEGSFEGPVSLQTALAKSINLVAIRVLQAIGPSYAQDWIARFGFDADKNPPYLTMALGAGSVTAMQLVDAYSVFANGGYRLEPVLVSRLTDSMGHVLIQTPPQAPAPALRVIDARNAFVMTTMLQQVTRSGTAAKAQQILKRPDLYGKTGTTNESMDAWFAGFNPTQTAVVWIGYDTPRKLGAGETGGGLALPAWIEYMQHALAGVPVQPLVPPTEGVVNADGSWVYDEFSGGRGVASLGLDDKVPQPPTTEERNSILDLFRR